MHCIECKQMGHNSRSQERVDRNPSTWKVYSYGADSRSQERVDRNFEPDCLANGMLFPLARAGG